MILKRLSARYSLLLVFSLLFQTIFSQIDSNYVEEEEDYSIYDNVEDVGVIKTYCSPKVLDLSPNRFISIGYDLTGKGLLKTTAEGMYAPDESIGTYDGSSKINYRGLRINANIPVISKSSFIWQIGGGFNQSRIQGENALPDGEHKDFVEEIGLLTSLSLKTTLFKPVGEKTFLILQILGELNGNYDFKTSKTQPDFDNTRLSATFLYGRRPHDRLQWGIGVTRSYRAGDLNYLPVFMYNFTSANRKWGTEILFPARAAYRRKFNSRNILLAGYVLEGGTYRLYDTPFVSQNLELRRSEIRLRLDYQKQIKGFIWLGIQAGVILNYSFNVDDLGDSNRDFFRGFFGNQNYTMLNNMAPMPYLNISLNIVSK